jgi:HAD superfamily hydrolase (TIGR01509 family)
MPSAILFDIDGTLVDSVDLHAEAWRQAFLHFGRDIPLDVVRSQIGKGGDQLIPALLGEEDRRRFGEELDHHRSELYKSRFLPQVHPFPGVRELFEALRRRGKRIALASSAKGDELATYLRLTGIEGLLEGQTSADDADRSKPHPDIFQAALEQLGRPPASAAAAVGDTPWDAIAAGKAGLVTVGVLCGGFDPEDLRRAGCVELWRDPADLLAHLDGSLLAR